MARTSTARSPAPSNRAARGSGRHSGNRFPSSRSRATGSSAPAASHKGERKATGSYYTPDYIVKYMVEQSIGPALRAAVAGQTDNAGRIEAVLAVKVLDPAMGSAHFLVEATEYIARFLVDLGVMPDGVGAYALFAGLG